MDREIGRLLLGLQRLGVLEDALVVITADHGETFWDGPNAWNHGLWVGQPEVAVPLIVRGPAGAEMGRGRVVDTPVSGVDVMPTVLELAGVSARGCDLDGRSLAGAIGGGRSLDDRAVFSEATQPGAALEAGVLRWQGSASPSRCDSGAGSSSSAGYLGLRQLFDLNADPAEREDLLRGGGGDPEAGRPRIASARTLARWRASADPRPVGVRPRAGRGARRPRLRRSSKDPEDDR